MAKGKKNKAATAVKEEQPSDDDSLSSSSEEEKPQAKKTNKKATEPAKKKPVKVVDSDSDGSASSDDEPAAAAARKPGFALLMGDDSDSDSDHQSESETEEVKPAAKPAKNKKKQKVPPAAEEIEVEDPEPQKKGGKKSKKKKKKDEDDEEDLDKMLAELQLEYSGQKGPASAATAKEDEKAESADKEKGKKKQKAEREEEAEEENDDEEETGGTVKTAAQKRKEKKDRQKQKLAAQKMNASKQKDKKEEKGEKMEVEKKKAVEEPPKEDPTAETKEGEEAEEGDKKKKKKKKGKGEEKEEEKKKGRKPAKGTLLAMQEALKKAQEDEERMRREEEERIRLEEEAEAARLEKKRLDEEKKALKKQREKEKKEQLRREGKLLTAKQKADKARAEAMLAAMKAQGIDVPQVGEKRGPRPGTRVRTKKNKDANKEASPVSEEAEVKVDEVKVEVEEKKEEDDVKDAWDASDSEEDVKDSWDAEEEEQEEKKEEASQATQASASSADANGDATSDEEEDDESSDEDSDDSDDDQNEEEKRRERALERIRVRKEENEKNRTTDNLRAPVVCVLGHVDTGKTKILDKLRRTHVQDGEAGGITQQIGATNVPISVVKEQCKMVKNFGDPKLPGLLIIDTPGHESFSNLRDRGSSLCDIAILVVDIMHNLEPQTIESINLLKKKKTPFVIALNKVDRLYEWKSNRHKDVSDVVASQQPNTRLEFDKRAREVITAMAEQGLNAALYYDNPDPKTYISMVPTSAHSGDGMGNLMGLLVQLSQGRLAKRLSYTDELQATVLEVKEITGLGTTIDIVLVNGALKEGQTIVVAGTEGPVVTQIKALLTTAKMQDLRVKNSYVEHKELRAAQGVKIAAKHLEKTIAGLNMLVAYHPDELDICKEEMQRRYETAINSIKLKERGVFVQASTLGSLEALLEFLKTSSIPYAGVKIGPVVKRDVMKASVMLEHEEKYTVILAFDVRVERDAQEMADSMGVKIFQADIIYHLFDRFTEYQEQLLKRKQEENKHLAVFPCKLRVLPNLVFKTRDPIVAGVLVEAGIVRTGTPACVPSKEFLQLGIITSIQNNHKDVDSARKGEEVCIKIEPIPGESPKLFGRHFDETDLIYSKISRETIDCCKQYFRDELQKSDWVLMKEMKKVFDIM